MDNLPVPQPQPHIYQLLAQAVEKGVSVETLERLLAMQTQLEAKHAKEQFDSAMSAFQAECPVITKRQGVTGNNSVVVFKFAPIETIIKIVQPLLTKHGFSHSTDVTFDGENYIVTCTANHTLGHSKQSTFPAVPDKRENKMTSDVQKLAAAISFAKRYAFMNVFGITVGGEDNEQRLTEYKAEAMQFVTLATKEQQEEIENLIIESQLPLQGILQQCKVDKLEALTSQQAQAVITKMERYIERKNNERSASI